MKKKTTLLISLFLGSILAVTSFSGVTFAWLLHSSAIEEIKVDASSLQLTPQNQRIFKYVFPAYKDSNGHDTSIIDYLSQGSIKNVGAASRMNTLDPTYLTIQNTVSQEGISGLYTNIVLEFSFEITYTTSTNLYVTAERSYDSYVPSQKGAQRISDFIHFDLFKESDFENYYDSDLEHQRFTGDGTKTAFVLPSLPKNVTSVTIDDVLQPTDSYSVSESTITFDNAPESAADIVVGYSTIWHAVKAASEAKTTHSNFALRNNYLEIDDVVLEQERPTDVTTSQYTYYLNIEYDFDLCSSDDVFNFFAPTKLGDSYVLDKDYALSFGVKQGAK